MARTFIQNDELPIVFPTETTTPSNGVAGPLEDGDSFNYINNTTIPETNTTYIYDTSFGTWTQ